MDKSVELKEIVRSSMVAGEKEYISMLRDENNKLRDEINKLRDENNSQAKDIQILRKRLSKQRSQKEEWEDSSLTSESMMTVKNPIFR